MPPRLFPVRRLAGPMTGAGAQARAPGSPGRIEAIDLLRGVAILLMTLDHARDFFFHPAGAPDPTDLTHAGAALFLTRWITHFCAPVFVLLAGVSAQIRRQRGTSAGELASFLLVRGLLLVLLEASVVTFGWGFSFDRIFLQVIWALGVSMIVLAGFVRFPASVSLVAGLAITLLHNLLDGVNGETFGLLWRLFEPGPAMLGGLKAMVAYPAVPWAGVMLTGYGLAPLLTSRAADRDRWLMLAGAGAVAAFIGLRLIGGYGEPTAWTRQPDLLRTALAFVNTTKYPPSLQFLLMTLGPVLLAYPLLDRLRGRVADAITVYGCAPLFYYLAHIYLLHGLMLAAGVMSGRPWTDFINPLWRRGTLAGWGVDLWGVYVIALTVAAALYLPCAAFGRLKRRHPRLLGLF